MYRNMICITTFCDKLIDVQVFLTRLCSVSCILLCSNMWMVGSEVAMLISSRLLVWFTNIISEVQLLVLLKLGSLYRIQHRVIKLIVHWHTFVLGITGFLVPWKTNWGEKIDWSMMNLTFWLWLIDLSVLWIIIYILSPALNWELPTWWWA